MDYKRLLQVIIHDPMRKIFAIVFAFGLWLFVAVGYNYQYTKNIQIVYSNLPEDRILVDSLTTVNVTFTGGGVSLLNIWAATPKAQCDLSKTKLGENKIPVKNIVIPIGFRDVSIDYQKTTSIDITIDRKITKEMRVVVPIKGSLRNRISISDITVLDTVVVTGPNEILRNVDEVMTESLNVQNRNKSFTKELRLLNPSSLIDVSEDIVTANVTVDTTVERTFVNIPLKLLYAPNQLVYTEKITLDTLIVQGAKSRMADLKKSDIEVRIRLINMPVGNHSLPAEVILPDYIKPVYSNPQRFKITIY
ncbi:MAG: hypothetical protein JSV97_02735 [candidate division WOR-3 bacterium]|nr:MAG: hypothetical protein JSV97_02735 [candidate division WOR-3 bacterium]